MGEMERGGGRERGGGEGEGEKGGGTMAAI